MAHFTHHDNTFAFLLKTVFSPLFGSENHTYSLLVPCLSCQETNLSIMLFTKMNFCILLFLLFVILSLFFKSYNLISFISYKLILSHLIKQEDL